MRLRPVSIALSIVILTGSIARAEESVRSTQEELRRRNIYFGDIDGRRSSEYEEAVRRYQRKKGFGASGKEDPDTLRSLGLLARSPLDPAPKELEWPEQPVLKSDTRVNVVQEARELASATGVAPESIATIEPASPGRPGRKGVKGGATTGGYGRAAVPTAGRSAQVVTRDDALDIVKRYLRAVSKGDLKEELSLYADRVNYYGNGSIDRRIIEHQLRKYYAQWPSRSYSLARVTGLSSQPATGEITVTFQVSFSLKNAHGRAKGMTENQVVINAATSSPRIVAIRERRLRQ